MYVCMIRMTVDFVAAYVFELVDRPGRPLVGAEAFIEGVFQVLLHGHRILVARSLRPHILVARRRATD